MVDFLNLVRNENMKMFRAPRLFVMLGIVIGLIFVVSIIWFSYDYGSLTSDMWEVTLVETSVLFWVVTIFAVIAASGTVAEEFSSGTIKLLLIRPWSRSKILMSKYIASLLFALFMTLVFLLAALLINWILFDLIGNAQSSAGSGFGSALVGGGEESDAALITRYYLLTFLNTVMTVTISFMLSTIFRSNVLAIAMALFIEIVLNNLLQLLQLFDKKWIDYLIFVHLNLTKYAGGNVSATDGMTLGFSLSVLAVYYVVFIALTWYIFNKRDVAS
ncbi:ABC transporter permease [Paenibacillus soyae]|uniref:ABC transporter permease n=1 Tax=Paenibacillus soyae TaxID=2969249 RepID=A0A9X2SAL9_9BACL|nr:ABC transporter permease [Paenibacillus soyae]MCR2806135.1 ABC transporter permease [Paenibacillus soyae]